MAGFGTGLVQGMESTRSLLDTFQKQKQLALRQQEAGISQGKLDLEKRKSEVEYGVPGSDKPGLAERRVKLTEDQQRMVEQTAENDYYRKLKFKPKTIRRNLGALADKFPKSAGSAFQPLLDAIDKQTVTTRAEAISEIQSLHAMGKLEPLREDLRKAEKELREKGKTGLADELGALESGLGPKEFPRFLAQFTGMPMHMWPDEPEQYATGPKEWDPATQSWIVPTSRGPEKLVQAASTQTRRVVYDREGNPILVEGGDGEIKPQITKKTQTEFEEEIRHAEQSRVRLRGMLDNFKYEFLTAEGKFKKTMLKLKEVFKLGKLTPDERQYLTDATTFVQDTVDNFNRTVRDFTGAVMNREEISRYTLSTPNVGKTWVTGDSATEFLAKANNLLDKANEGYEAAVRRYRYYVDQGLTPSQVDRLIKDKKIAPIDNFIEQSQSEQGVGDMSDEAIKAELGIK